MFGAAVDADTALADSQVLASQLQYITSSILAAPRAAQNPQRCIFLCSRTRFEHLALTYQLTPFCRGKIFKTCFLPIPAIHLERLLPLPRTSVIC